MRRITITFSLLLLALSQLTQAKVLGVPESKIALYQSSNGKFKCLDGSAEISFSAVNDDYCDCQDGSDEPGTSACPESQFTCQNLEYFPVAIPASWVGDGICDCCDGSDETKISCPNTCAQKGASARAEALRAHTAQAAGFQKRSEYVSQAIEEAKKRTTTIDELKVKLAGLEQELEQLLEIKEKAEEEEKLAIERQRQKEELPLNKKVELFCTEFQSNIKSLSDEINRLREHLVSLRDTSSDQTVISSLDTAVTQAESILSKVPAFPNLCANLKIEPPAADSSKEGHQAHHHDPLHDDHDDDHYHDEYEDQEDHAEVEKPKAEPKPEAKIVLGSVDPEITEDDGENEGKKDGEQWDVSVLDTLMSTCSSMLQEYLCYFNLIDCSAEPLEPTLLHIPAIKARDDYASKENEVKETKSQLHNLEKIQETDLGPQGEYFHIYEKCFEYHNPEYTYEFCPFSSCTQKPKRGGGSHTNLGTYVNWSGPQPNRYSSMKFDNGLKCWGGPSRSTDVKFICGDKEEVLGVEEPAKCEYSMTFTTPLACGAPKSVEELFREAATRKRDEL